MATWRERWNRFWGRTPAAVETAKTLGADTQRTIPEGIQEARTDGRLDRLPKNDQFRPQDPGAVAVELPPLPLGDWSNPAAISAALQALSVGQVQGAARLSKALLTDPRIYGPMGIRCKGIVGLPKAFKPANDSEQAKQIAAICEKHFDEWFTVTEQETFLRNFVMLGASLAQMVFPPPAPGAEYQAPEINCWDLANSVAVEYWDGQNRNFGRWIISTKDGTIEPVPGDGQWVFGTQTAKAPWENALINPLGMRFAARQNTLYRWTKYNDRIASPFFVLGNPTAQNTEAVNLIRRQVETGSPIIVVPIGKDGNKWTAEWVAVNTATGSASFNAAFNIYAADCAIAILGQNLSTEVKGGSHAAARVHDDVKQAIIEFDAKSLASIFREQVLKPFVAQNWNVPVEYAPYIIYETKSETSLKDFATALASVGQWIGAIAKVPEAIGNIDFNALWVKLGVPLIKAPGAPVE